MITPARDGTQPVEWPDHGFVPCCARCDPSATCVRKDACCTACFADGVGMCVGECVCGQPICTVEQPTVLDGVEQVHPDCYAAAVDAGLRSPGGDDA